MQNNTTEADILELRRQWQSLNERIERLEKKTAMPPAVTRRPESSRTKLAKQIRIVMILAFVYIWMSVPLFRLGIFPGWICIYLSAFFAVCGINGAILYRRICSLDLTCISAAEALKGVYSLKSFRRNIQIFDIVIAIPLLVGMFWHMHAVGEYMFVGGITGAIIGAIIGLRMDRKQRRLLAEMRTSLEEELAEEAR